MFQPTLTLAKLYEGQGNYVEALAIYRYLSPTQKEAKEKVEKLFDKVYSEPDGYDKIIEKIFSKKELKNFKILSTENYKKYHNVLAKADSVPSIKKEKSNISLT